MQHEESEETTALLSNHESHDARPSKLKRNNDDVAGEAKLEDLEAGPSIHDGNNGTRWTRLKSFIRQLYNNNIGLLLIVASQSFFACMNLFVKLLTALDNPVPTLEVRRIVL
jgi:hypothetical protein